MGTHKQADTLVKLYAKARALPAHGDAERLRTMVLAASHAEVQELFKKVNAVLGWNKEESLSTDKQLQYICALEKVVYGTAIHATARAPMTYEEADARIKYLQQARNDMELLNLTRDAMQDFPVLVESL
jgi:hypothetical protein